MTLNEITKPFVGGGAVLFDILSNYNISEVYISDINAELINAYNSIRNECNLLIEKLHILKKEYMSDSIKQSEYYYAKRERFNELKKNNSLN